MPYFFYLARCHDNSLYAGICKDLLEREKKHNEGKGAKYTRARLPVQFIYSETFATKSDAMKREAEVKKWKKEEKETMLTQKTKNIRREAGCLPAKDRKAQKGFPRKKP